MIDEKPCPSCIFNFMVLSFGKHAGKRLIDLPEDYLEWLAAQGWGEIIRAEFDCLENHKDRTKYYDTVSR